MVTCSSDEPHPSCAGPTEPCFHDVRCVTVGTDPLGGLGCNAGSNASCRFCGFGAYTAVPCPTKAPPLPPPGAPELESSPTFPPAQMEALSASPDDGSGVAIVILAVVVLLLLLACAAVWRLQRQRRHQARQASAVDGGRTRNGDGKTIAAAMESRPQPTAAEGNGQGESSGATSSAPPPSSSMGVIGLGRVGSERGGLKARPKPPTGFHSERPPAQERAELLQDVSRWQRTLPQVQQLLKTTWKQELDAPRALPAPSRDRLQAYRSRLGLSHHSLPPQTGKDGGGGGEARTTHGPPHAVAALHRALSEKGSHAFRKKKLQSLYLSARDRDGDRDGNPRGDLGGDAGGELSQPHALPPPPRAVLHAERTRSTNGGAYSSGVVAPEDKTEAEWALGPRRASVESPGKLCSSRSSTGRTSIGASDGGDGGEERKYGGQRSLARSRLGSSTTKTSFRV